MDKQTNHTASQSNTMNSIPKTYKTILTENFHEPNLDDIYGKDPSDKHIANVGYRLEKIFAMQFKLPVKPIELGRIRPRIIEAKSFIEWLKFCLDVESNSSTKWFF